MKNLAELQHEVDSLGITYLCTDTKEDLMDLLAVHYRENDVDRPPLIPQLPVMLARNTKDLKEDIFSKMLENKNSLWVAEAKLDGVRAKLHLGPSSNRIDSRHRSNTTYEYVEKTDCLPHLRNLKHAFAGTVLDGELIMPVEKIKDGKTDTDSYLTSTTATVNSGPKRAIYLQGKYGNCRFFAFDILFHCGEDVRHLPYRQRYSLLFNVLRRLELTSSCIYQPARFVARFADFFKRLVMGGGEGIMLKRLNWPYESRKRSKGTFKMKKEGAPIDAFVTGFVPGEGEFSGLIGSLLLSVMVNGQAIEIAAVQPGDLPFRNKISLADGSLAEDMYGKVVEVSYFCKTKNKRLRHAVLERFRPDKNLYECEEKI